MPTNKERRDVAARLRDIDAKTWHTTWHELCAIKNACGCYAGQDKQDVELKDRLADLIEPEERTCRMKKKESKYVLSGWWECDECGIVYPPCNEEIALWALQYCPHCGAKVVQE